MNNIIQIDENSIKNKIYTIRGIQVMLDRDLAKLYSVKAIRLREQVKRNKKRFPEDFMFQLDDSEIDFIVSQNAIPSKQHDEKFNTLFKALEDKSIKPTQGIFYDGQTILIINYKFLIFNYLIIQYLSFKTQNYLKWFAFSKMDGESLSVLRRLK